MLVSEKGVTIRYVVWVGAIQLKEKKNGLIIEPRKAGRELKKNKKCINTTHSAAGRRKGNEG